MSYFDFFSNIMYKFPNGVTYNVKNIFTRPIIESTLQNTIDISDNQSPDQLSALLYEDPSLYYINLLNNDIVSDNYWPVTGAEYAENFSSKFAGYAFHMLENPELKPARGDVVVLKSDFIGFTPNNDDLEEITLSYGIIEKWDPTYRKLWIKNYSFGNTGSQTTSDFFKEDNRFYIFKRNQDGTYANDGSQVKASNVSGDSNAFVSDPNYPGNSGDEFTMKRVNLYTNSVHHFSIGDNDVELNPYTKNLVVSGSNISFDFTDFAGTTYNSGNTNGTCSFLDGYILSANGQTGPDNYPYTTSQKVISVEDMFRSQNDERRNIQVIPESVVGDIVESIEREFNG